MGSAPTQYARCSCVEIRVPLFVSQEKSIYFLKRKAVGRGFSLRASTRPSRLSYCSRATIRVCLCDALFLSRRLDLLEAHFRHVSDRHPVGQRFDLP
jgi:hypothetical protein